MNGNVVTKMMVNEYTGMAYGMTNEFELKKKQLKLYDENIIPALRNNYKNATRMNKTQNCLCFSMQGKIVHGATGIY
jgi:hypothetical protein